MEAKFKALEKTEDLSILNGLAFEEYLRQLFTDLGYSAEKTPASGDFGADLILSTKDKKIVVQAKRYSNEIGFDAVKEIHFARTFYNANEAWVICTSGFTNQAYEAAKNANVKLLGPLEIDALISDFHSGKTIDGKELEQSWNKYAAFFCLTLWRASGQNEYMPKGILSSNHGRLLLFAALAFLESNNGKFAISEFISKVPNSVTDAEFNSLFEALSKIASIQNGTVEINDEALEKAYAFFRKIDFVLNWIKDAYGDSFASSYLDDSEIRQIYRSPLFRADRTEIPLKRLGIKKKIDSERWEVKGFFRRLYNLNLFTKGKGGCFFDSTRFTLWQTIKTYAESLDNKLNSFELLKQANDRFEQMSINTIMQMAHERVNTMYSYFAYRDKFLAYSYNFEGLIFPALFETGGGVPFDGIAEWFNKSSAKIPSYYELTLEEAVKEDHDKDKIISITNDMSNNKTEYYLKFQCDVFGNPFRDHYQTINYIKKQIDSLTDESSADDLEESSLVKLEYHLKLVNEKLSKLSLFDRNTRKRLIKEQDDLIARIAVLKVDQKYGIQHETNKPTSIEKKSSLHNQLNEIMTEATNNKRLFLIETPTPVEAFAKQISE